MNRHTEKRKELYTDMVFSLMKSFINDKLEYEDLVPCALFGFIAVEDFMKDFEND